MAIDRKKFIEEQFLILDREGRVVPFKFYPVQDKYYNILVNDYGPSFRGVREIVLKARQEGQSSFILGLFAVDFITKPNSISICISHRRDSTQLLFKKVKFFIESYCQKQEWNVKEYLSTDNKSEIQNRTNGAYFYIGTAGSKVGGRGGTAQNLHFSEAAFYSASEKITAKEIIEGTSQQIAQGTGMIFIESTANGYGNYYQHIWEMARKGESNYHPRFFSWEEFYDKEWVERKRGDFETDAMWKQEYPNDPYEAFISSGSPYFDIEVLRKMLEEAPKPLQEGRLAQDGRFI